MGHILPVVNTINKAQILPSEVTPRLYGDQNQEGLFSFYVDDIISLVTTGGSAFMRWLPSRGVINWKEPIAHLTWIAPEGFDGSQTYADFLASKDEVEECDFGDGFVYQICEYVHTMDRMSWSTRNEPIKQENLGMKLFDQQPIPVLRGETAGITLANDCDWSLARLGMGAEESHNWNVIYGDRDAFPNTYLGINGIVSTGWVKSLVRGKGSCDFTDPIVIPGGDLDTNEAILRKIRAVARRIIRRMAQRNYTPSGDDMVIMMNDVMWAQLASTLAWGVMETQNPPAGYTLQTTPEVVMRELSRVSNGGLGYGFIPVGNYNIPVIPETRIGAGSTNTDGDPSVTGDIFILTKNFRGIRVLEHQYLDWARLGNRPLEELSGFKNGEYQPQFFQNGMLRVSVQTLTTNNLCWFYGADMYGRIVSYMNMLQARINDVTVVTDMAGDNESSSFTSQDFYAFQGEIGGDGTGLLVPLT